MVELEDGLSKKQVEKLLSLVPNDAEVFPITLQDLPELVEANSMAIGFIRNDYYDARENVLKTWANVCNDWENEREDYTYLLAGEDDKEEALQVILLCDFETIK